VVAPYGNAPAPTPAPASTSPLLASFVGTQHTDDHGAADLNKEEHSAYMLTLPEELGWSRQTRFRDENQ